MQLVNTVQSKELLLAQNVFYAVNHFAKVDMIRSGEIMENVLENKKHEVLFRLANQQGVKPTEKVEDLYKNSDNTFDVDDFLETVEEIRKSDVKKHA